MPKTLQILFKIVLFPLWLPIAMWAFVLIAIFVGDYDEWKDWVDRYFSLN